MDSRVKGPAAGDKESFLELPRPLTHVGRPAPRLEILEANGRIELTAEIPGVPKDAVEVILDGDILTISVDKRNPNEGKSVHVSERPYGRFERSIQLPFTPAADSVQASVENGVLVLSFPRADRQRTHKIAIRGARPEREAGAIGSSWREKPAAAAEPLTLDVKAKPVP
jgi:HSP20 family protein